MYMKSTFHSMSSLRPSGVAVAKAPRVGESDVNRHPGCGLEASFKTDQAAAAAPHASAPRMSGPATVNWCGKRGGGGDDDGDGDGDGMFCEGISSDSQRRRQTRPGSRPLRGDARRLGGGVGAHRYVCVLQLAGRGTGRHQGRRHRRHLLPVVAVPVFDPPARPRRLPAAGCA
jgi:hypothetical protein